MSVTAEFMLNWCQILLDTDGRRPQHSLAQWLESIPRLASLESVPSGTAVLVRGDVDAKPGEKVGEGDIRLRSMVETLRYGRQHGWKQIVFGHRGRKPEETLGKVAARLGQLLECDVPLVENWLDPSSLTVAEHVTQTIAASAPGSVLVLENTRRYDIERVLWKAQAEDLPKLAEPLAQFANQMAEKVAQVYINEALSAGSLDTSTTVVPAAMRKWRWAPT